VEIIYIMLYKEEVLGALWPEKVNTRGPRAVTVIDLIIVVVTLLERDINRLVVEAREMLELVKL